MSSSTTSDTRSPSKSIQGKSRKETDHRVMILEQKIQTLRYVDENLCSCETCHKGRTWIRGQIEKSKMKLQELKDECTE